MRTQPWFRLAAIAAAPASAVALCSGAPKAQTWPSLLAGDGTVLRRRDGTVEAVSGCLNYQARDVEEVRTRRDTTGSDDVLHGANWAPMNTMVRNGRGMGLNLDDNGFELRTEPLKSDARSGEIDLFKEADIVGPYYADCEALVRRVTGASKVVAFDHNVRSERGRSAGQRIPGGNLVQGPAPLVHGDYTAASAPRRLLQLGDAPKANDVRKGAPLLDAQEVSAAMSGDRRFGIINVWRPITGPVEERPLACCDARSVSASDLLTFFIEYADRVGENYFARKSEGHSWWFFPSMTPEEVILIKTWDSTGVLEPRAGSEDRAAFALHSAFADPSSPPEPKPRESMEVRCVVLYDA